MRDNSNFDIENAKDRKRRLAEQEKRAKERKAREKLEAAAPKLLEACKIALERLDVGDKEGEEREYIDIIKAAIAAAE